jgi:hypothetical protein
MASEIHNSMFINIYVQLGVYTTPDMPKGPKGINSRLQMDYDVKIQGFVNVWLPYNMLIREVLGFSHQADTLANINQSRYMGKYQSKQSYLGHYLREVCCVFLANLF